MSLRPLWWPWLGTLGTFAAAALVALVVRRVALGGVRRWTHGEGLLGAGGELLRGASLWWCLVVGLYAANEVALEFRLLPPRWYEQLRVALEAAVIISITITLAAVGSRVIGRAGERRAMGVAVTGLAQTATRITVFVVGLLVLLSALGIQIVPILTALGVGGLAVALALQDSLANLFAGVHLLADRPIRVGDFVKVGDSVEGFVIDIGWRSTRIRSLANNVLVLPNQTVAKATIVNYELPEPRMGAGLRISVDRSADPAHVEEVLLDEATRAAGHIPGLLGDPAPGVSLIPGFGEFSLDFTVGYHVATFVDQYKVEHELRKRLFDRLRKESIGAPVRPLQITAATAA